MIHQAKVKVVIVNDIVLTDWGGIDAVGLIDKYSLMPSSLVIMLVFIIIREILPNRYL